MGTLEKQKILMKKNLSPTPLGYLLKEFVPLRSKFFPIRVDPILEGFCRSRELFSFVKLA